MGVEMSKPRLWRFLRRASSFCLVVALAACASQPVSTAYDVPGFWMGLIHGFTAGFALIGEIFFDHRIYAFPNNGGWYDLGFMLGIGLFGGGSSSTVR